MAPFFGLKEIVHIFHLSLWHLSSEGRWLNSFIFPFKAGGVRGGTHRSKVSLFQCENWTQSVSTVLIKFLETNFIKASKTVKTSEEPWVCGVGGQRCARCRCPPFLTCRPMFGQNSNSIGCTALGKRDSLNCANSSALSMIDRCPSRVLTLLLLLFSAVRLRRVPARPTEVHIAENEQWTVQWFVFHG